MPAPSRRPAMTDAGLEPTAAVEAVDEFQQVRELRVADERPLTIYVDSYEIVTLMTLGRTPELLALGYLKNQGLLEDISEVSAVQVDWEVNAAAVTTHSKREDWRERLGPRIVTTGCGQGTVYGNIMEELDKIALRPSRLRQSDLYALLKNLGRCNDVYKNAGAVHGCALCAGTEVAIFREDVGRHNAVDAIAGEMWLEGLSGHDKLFYTTGRLTSEMVIKVAQMGISALLSRSGVTQMGLRLARDFGITLFSRAAGRHFLIYNGAERVEFDAPPPPKRDVANLRSAEGAAR